MQGLEGELDAVEPAFLQRRAAWPKSRMMRAKSQSSIALGKERCSGSRTAEGATGASQLPASQRVRRPIWEIWHISAAPSPWIRSENSRKCGMMRSSLTSSWPKVAGQSGETTEEPPNMVRAMPPLAFSA
jgi:hypothetical protein